MFKFPFNLQRFSEGGQGAASAQGSSSGTNASVNQNVTEKGGVDGQPANGTVKDTDKKSQYESFKAQYKEFYDEDVKNHVTRRHKDYGVLSKAKAEQDEFLSLLHARYGTSDLKGLREALEADDGFWQSQADMADMTVEQYKEKVKKDLEFNRMKGELNAVRVQEQARAQYETWANEAKSVKEIHPEFDLNTELQNVQFRNMLSAKYAGDYMPSMLDIYEMIHRGELMEKAKADAQKSTIDSIRARGMRPDEAGSDSSGAVDYSKNASNMSKKERADIARRVKGGTRYTFSG